LNFGHCRYSSGRGVVPVEWNSTLAALIHRIIVADGPGMVSNASLFFIGLPVGFFVGRPRGVSLSVLGKTLGARDEANAYDSHMTLDLHSPCVLFSGLGCKSQNANGIFNHLLCVGRCQVFQARMMSRTVRVRFPRDPRNSVRHVLPDCSFTSMHIRLQSQSPSCLPLGRIRSGR
jgi:hypothetical protein